MNERIFLSFIVLWIKLIKFFHFKKILYNKLFSTLIKHTKNFPENSLIRRFKFLNILLLMLRKGIWNFEILIANEYSKINEYLLNLAEKNIKSLRLYLKLVMYSSRVRLSEIKKSWNNFS